jgi:microcystin degradation protein MlrC
VVVRKSVLVVKLGYFEPELAEIAKTAILVLTDGSTNEKIEALPYVNVRRPVFPLDRDFVPDLKIVQNEEILS